MSSKRLSPEEAQKWLMKLDVVDDEEDPDYEEDEDKTATRKLRRELEAIIDPKQKELFS